MIGDDDQDDDDDNKPVSVYKNDRCICKRVRITSCGYVAIEAVIFDIAEQIKILGVVRGPSDRDSVDGYIRQARWDIEMCTYERRHEAAHITGIERRHGGCLGDLVGDRDRRHEVLRSDIFS